MTITSDFLDSVWAKWARNLSSTVSDEDAPERLAETLYLGLATAAGLVTEKDRDLFSFYCAGASEFLLNGNNQECLVLLRSAESLSGKSILWIRDATAAIRSEMKARGVRHPR